MSAVVSAGLVTGQSADESPGRELEHVRTEEATSEQ
jgi:hypothetical protein